MEKKKALFVMHRLALADAFREYAEAEAGFEITVEPSCAMAALTAEACDPAIVLIEIPESGPWRPAEKCLAVCDIIKRQSVGRKIIILCPEDDAEACGAVIAAKREGRIDDFLYYETSIEYLFSKLRYFAE